MILALWASSLTTIPSLHPIIYIYIITFKDPTTPLLQATNYTHYYYYNNNTFFFSSVSSFLDVHMHPWIFFKKPSTMTHLHYYYFLFTIPENHATLILFIYLLLLFSTCQILPIHLSSFFSLSKVKTFNFNTHKIYVIFTSKTI